MEYIETSDASSAEKDEAKSRLQRFLEHPLLAAVVSGLTASLANK
jgi:bifunctional DNase/RNase